MITLKRSGSKPQYYPTRPKLSIAARKPVGWLFEHYLPKNSIISLGLALMLLVNWVPASSAQKNEAFIRLVRAMEPDDTGLSNPAGLAFSSRVNAFHVVKARGRAQPLLFDTDILKLTPYADRAGSTRINAQVQDPINIAFDNKAHRLLIFLPAGNQLLEVQESPEGNLDSTTLIRHNARQFGLGKPQGMTLDPASGHLFILDAVGPTIIRVEPKPDGSFDGGVISSVGLQPTGLTDVRGLALDPTTGHLHLISRADQRLYELTQTGDVVAIRDLSEFGLGDPQGMVFAPSGDQTDDPLEMSLYLADSGNLAMQSQDSRSVQGGQPAAQPIEGIATIQGSGQIVELSFVELPAPAASTFQASLIRTTDLSAISPPSPDPSGITYISASNTLLMSDGEVEETVGGITHFQGANVWELTLSGGVIRTANISKVAPTVVPMSNEPTGVAWNPVNGHVFVTDDGAKKVFDLNPGLDGVLGTADDSWTSFSTTQVGNTDPEGITYDTSQHRLFVADGVNMEVYEYTTNGTPVSQFDVERYGVVDPESVEFNPDSGTLFIMSSRRQSRVIIETTTSGALLQTIDISAAESKIAAGLAYAPASDGSGTRRFYIVDRGIDNNTDPNIIDGKMYEMTAPSSSTPPPTPTFTSTPSVTPTPTPTPPSSDLIFANGFESGNLSAWSSSTTDGGDLSVSGEAALVGSYGLQAVINDNVSIYVTDDTPFAEPRYRARFYFDPNSILMANNNNHFIFYGYSGTSPAVLRVQFRLSKGNYQLRAGLRNDSTTWTNTSWFTISDAPHPIELDYQAATSAGANNGGLTLWIDGVQRASLGGIDNDTRRIDRVRLGPVAGIDSGTRGTYYFDAFESRRQTYIGP